MLGNFIHLGWMFGRKMSLKKFRMEDGSLEDGGWRMEGGGWKFLGRFRMTDLHYTIYIVI